MPAGWVFREQPDGKLSDGCVGCRVQSLAHSDLFSIEQLEDYLANKLMKPNDNLRLAKEKIYLASWALSFHALGCHAVARVASHRITAWITQATKYVFAQLCIFADSIASQSKSIEITESVGLHRSTQILQQSLTLMKTATCGDSFIGFLLNMQSGAKSAAPVIVPCEVLLKDPLIVHV